EPGGGSLPRRCREEGVARLLHGDEVHAAVLLAERAARRQSPTGGRRSEPRLGPRTNLPAAACRAVPDVTSVRLCPAMPDVSAAGRRRACRTEPPASRRRPPHLGGRARPVPRGPRPRSTCAPRPIRPGV